jgi:hypothetical protein
LILLISASQEARITGMSHWHPIRQQILKASPCKLLGRHLP